MRALFRRHLDIYWYAPLYWLIAWIMGHLTWSLAAAPVIATVVMVAFLEGWRVRHRLYRRLGSPS